MANEEAAKRAEASNTSGAQGGDPEQQATLLRVRVRDFGQLARLLGKIEQLSGVESTRRA